MDRLAMESPGKERRSGDCFTPARQPVYSNGFEPSTSPARCHVSGGDSANPGQKYVQRNEGQRPDASVNSVGGGAQFHISVLPATIEVGPDHWRLRHRAIYPRRAMISDDTDAKENDMATKVDQAVQKD